MDNGAASEKKSPVEQAVDVFVYAPLGLVLEARSLMPKLVERGRQQVTMTRMIGKFAVRQGQKQGSKILSKAGEQASAVLSEAGARDRAPDGAAATRASAPAPTEPTAADGTAPAASTAPSPPAKTVVTARSEEPASELAIADFDSLAASQVIPRLPGLSSAELEAVRSYEAVHRGRKTVLNKIAQLQSA